jgi:hypothetical protein
MTGEVSISSFDVPEDAFSEIQEFCRKYNHSPSTVSIYIHRGLIELHQFMGDARPKVRDSQANSVMARVKKRYSSPNLRIVRHGENV